MQENRPKRIYRQLTPDERARWEKARDEALALRPQMTRRARQLKEAANERTFSGALRGAIHRHTKPLPVIAAESGISITHLAEFLAGERTLRSDIIDRLAEVLGLDFPFESLDTPVKMAPADLTAPSIIQSASGIDPPIVNQ